MVTSASGARLATSIATLYGCAGTSSGAINSGVLIERTKSRDTVNTKSARLVYMLVRKSWTMFIVRSGRFAQSGGPQPLMLFWENRSGGSGLKALGSIL